MSVERNKALVRRYVEEVLNQKNLAVVDELFAPTFVDHDSSMPEAKGPEGIKRVAAMVHASFSDLHFTIEDMIAEGALGGAILTSSTSKISVAPPGMVGGRPLSP